MDDDQAPNALGPGGSFVHKDWNRASLLTLSVLTTVIAVLHVLDVIHFIHPALFILVAIVSAAGALIAPGPAEVTPGGIVLPLSWARRLKGEKVYLDLNDVVEARPSGDFEGLLELRTRDGRSHQVYLGRHPRVPSVMAYVIARVEVQEELRREARRSRKSSGGDGNGGRGGKKVRRGGEGGKMGKKGGA